VNDTATSLSCRPTSALEKLAVSLINAAVALVFLLPFLAGSFDRLELKLIFVGLFFTENLVAIVFHQYRLPGMWLLQTHWKKRYPLSQQLLHALLYTVSFSTLVFWVWLPGDLLLLNLLVLQLPCILLTGTTLHGWLAGNMVDEKRQA
jgi:hypothetical protein